ncbi:MAG: sulfatase [Deltaproteobacteria bacterium]|nr:sulfatase [Deltaproteobacteria bacterium]MBW2400631.1 sulfatase [Deltaproteobacteria bacterium]
MNPEVQADPERRTSPAPAVGWLLVSVAFCTVACSAARDTDLPLGLGDTNVLLLTLCTLRADHLVSYGYPKNTSPQLDRLARTGVLFEKVLAPAPWTRASMAAMITGLYPRSLEIEDPGRGRNDRVLDTSFETLAEHMASAGYFTIGITANPNGNAAFNFHQGYATYSGTGRLWRDGYKKNKISAARVADSFLARLDRVEGLPFFAHLVLVDMHLPYKNALAEKAGIPLDGTGPIAEYDRQLRYVDSVIGDLLAKLSERGFDNLLVIVNSDHGEGFGELNIFDQGHGANLYDSTIWVPWIVHHPALTASPRRLGGRVSGVDLVPTLLDLLQIPHDPKTLEGRSHASSILTGAPIAEREAGVVETQYRAAKKSAIVVDEHKLIVDYALEGEPALFLFDRSRDELENLAPTAPELARELQQQLTAWQHAHPGRIGAASKAAELSPGEVEALRALGYGE